MTQQEVLDIIEKNKGMWLCSHEIQKLLLNEDKEVSIGAIQRALSKLKKQGFIHCEYRKPKEFGAFVYYYRAKDDSLIDDKETLKEIIFKQKNEIKILKEQLNLINSNSWKGKAGYDVSKLGINQWKIIFYQKYNEDSKPRRYEEIIDNEYVDNLWEDIKSVTNKEKMITDYKELVPLIIKRYNLNIDPNSFNGSKTGEQKKSNRTLYYFPYYLYPLYVLQHLKLIKYSRKIKRLI